jgi:hypothetical protein
MRLSGSPTQLTKEARSWRARSKPSFTDFKIVQWKVLFFSDLPLGITSAGKNVLNILDHLWMSHEGFSLAPPSERAHVCEP